MDLIDLGLRYLNKIIIMKQEAQVRQHTYMSLDKLKNSSILAIHIYIINNMIPDLVFIILRIKIFSYKFLNSLKYSNLLVK